MMKLSVSLIFKVLLVLLFLLPLPFFAHEKSDTSHIRSIFTQQELAWLDSKPTLTYVYDPNWAPFEWKNDMGKHTGIIADIMKIIEDKTGIDFVAQNTETWEESVELVKNEKIPMFSAITQNSEREQYLHFTSKDFFSYPAVLITHFDDKTVYLDIEKDFKDKKIGIVKSSGLGLYIKEKYPQLNFIEIASTKEGFESVRSRKIDLFAINTITAKYCIEEKYFSDLKIAIKLDYIYHLKMAIHKNLSPEIISILDKTLDYIREDELNDIFNKWTEITIEEQTDWILIMEIVSVFLLVLVLLMFYNRKLYLMVEDRTKKLKSLNEKLQDLAATDSLTGIPNRRQLRHDFDHEAKRAKRFNRLMALFFLDIDNFKNINDNLGHEAGDALLKQIAKKITYSLRESERVYRVGGDEFCILAPEFTNRIQLENLAKRVIKEVADINVSDKKKFEIGCSIGIAIFQNNGITLADLMASADDAMYHIKSTSKNHFYFADDLN